MDSLSLNRPHDAQDRVAPRRLDLDRGPLLGRVAELDSRRIHVEMFDHDLVPRVTISHLVSFPIGECYLIGLIDGLSRRVERAVGVRGEKERGHDPPVAELRIMPIGTLHPGTEPGQSTFRRGASAYPHVAGDCHLIEGERLHGFMSVLAESVPPEERLTLGRYAANQDTVAVADGNRLFQRHVALLGATGTGKSWAVAQILERASHLAHANIVVLDLHREYGPLTEARNGEPPLAHGIRLAGPADSGGPDDELLYLPYWMLERDELITLVVNPDDPHASDQALVLADHIQTLKRAALRDAGLEQGVDTSTVDSPIPYRLEHLVDWLKRDDVERTPHHPSGRLESGPHNGKLSGLIARLDARIADPRYAFIFNPPVRTLNHDWLTATATSLLQAGRRHAGIKIVDLSEVPSMILPVVAGVLGRIIYDVQFWMEPGHRTPVCVVCDEAHLYLPSDAGSRFLHSAALHAFESIAKEGRKYGVSLLVVSQRPSDVSRTILSQCNNFMIMRVTSDRDREMIERLMPESLSGVMDVLPALEIGEAVVVGDALLIPTRIKLDAPTIRPASGTQPYWTLWSERPSSEQAIAAGVEALRRQLRVES